MTLSVSANSNARPFGDFGATVSMLMLDFDEVEDATDKAADDKLEVALILLTDDALLSEEVCGFVLLSVKPPPPPVEPPPPPHALKSNKVSNAKKVEACEKGELIIKTTCCMLLR